MQKNSCIVFIYSINEFHLSKKLCRTNIMFVRHNINLQSHLITLFSHFRSKLHRKWEKRVIFVRFNLYPDTNAHHRHRSDLQHGSLLVHQPGPPVAESFQDYEILLIDDGARTPRAKSATAMPGNTPGSGSSTNPTED